MTTLEELVELEPEPTHGYPIQIAAVSGVWRWVVELADTSAGSYVEWLDITEWYVGDRHQFGADQYMGDARARLVTVQLQIDESDLLAPWGLDTTELFGEDVELDAGLLMRAALARVAGGVTVEWLPIWTGRVETWGDASFARGQVRVHEVQVVDTMADLANVPTSIVSSNQPWDEVIVDDVLAGAGWLFGVDIYGDGGTSGAGIPQDLDMVAAANRMDQITDPLGLVWRSLRNGRLVVHPAPWDTTHTARYDNPLLAVYPDGLMFSYSPEFTDVEYIADDGQQPFGVSRTVAGVLNFFTVTAGTLVYAVDDPVSISKFGVRPFTASWILDNDPVVDDLLAARAFASVQALPLRTTIDHEGFFPALAMVDHLDPVTVEHSAADGRPVVTVVGTIRNVVEERTFRHITGDGDATLNWQSTVQIDVTSTTVADALLPVEDLALVSAFTPGFGGPSGAEFSWTNPTQPDITPTEVEVRILERSLIWQSADYPGVGADGIVMNWLTAATAYTFQVRLVRRVNGVATAVSPIREYLFTTPAVIPANPVPDGDETGGEFGEPPDFDPDNCELEVELQENDGDPDSWVTVDTLSGSEITDNGDGTWSPTTNYANSFFNEGSMYRYLVFEVCGTTETLLVIGPEWPAPVDWTDPCPAPANLAVAPYDDAIVYIPKICTGAEDGDPDFVFEGVQIFEAVSGIEAAKGDALLSVLQNVSDPGVFALKSIADPEWSETLGGVAYGACPQVVGVTGDKTILARVMVGDDSVSAVLFDCAAMRLTATAVSGGGWRPGVTVHKVGSTVSLAGASVLDEGTAYSLAASHELATGDIRLYVDEVEDNSVGGTDNVPTIEAVPAWKVGVPPDSWITDCALLDSVLEFAFDPGSIAGLWAWFDAADAATITASGGAVSQWDDKSGNGRHAVQATAGNKPTTGTRTANGLNVIDFDGSDWLHRTAAIGFPTGNYSLYIVCGSDADSSNFLRFLSFHNGGSDFDTADGFCCTQGNASNRFAHFQISNLVESGASSGATQFGTWSVRKGTGSQEWEVMTPAGGTNLATNASSGTANGGFVIGAGFESGVIGTNAFNGPIAEILLYTGLHVDADRDAVRAYLIAKWGA